MNMERKTIQLQIVFFLKEDYEGNFEALSLKVQSILGVPKNPANYTPLPSRAPSELPRVTLQYPHANMNLSKNRIDLFAENYLNLKDIASKIAKILLNDFLLNIVRIAMVKTSFLEEGNVKQLKKLLNDKLSVLDIIDTTLRINVNQNINNIIYNNNESVNLGTFQKIGERPKNGIVVVRDINTQAPVQNYDLSVITLLLDELEKESEKEILFT